jgi:hypothetical protein
MSKKNLPTVLIIPVLQPAQQAVSRWNKIMGQHGHYWIHTTNTRKRRPVSCKKLPAAGQRLAVVEAGVDYATAGLAPV